MTSSQRAIIELARAMRDLTGNLPMLPGIYPDYRAPIVRNGAYGQRELVMARWGMPSSHQALFNATKKRAQKLEAKGKPVDFKELLRMEPDGGVRIFETSQANIGPGGWASSTGASCRSLPSANSIRPPAATSGSLSMRAGP